MTENTDDSQPYIKNNKNHIDPIHNHRNVWNPNEKGVKDRIYDSLYLIRIKSREAFEIRKSKFDLKCNRNMVEFATKKIIDIRFSKKHSKCACKCPLWRQMACSKFETKGRMICHI